MKKFLFLSLLFSPLTALAQAPSLSWVSKDVHYSQKVQPLNAATRDTLVTSWRGERLGMQALIYAPQTTGKLQLRVRDLKNRRHTIPASQVMARFVNYVITDNYQSCGNHPTHLTPYTVPDIINVEAAQSVEGRQAQPVWCTVEVPRDAEPGIYCSRLELVDSVSQKVVQKIDFSVKVLDRTLPAPADQKFHVDFWQQPYAVSRYYGLKRWSDEHFKALKPYLQLLARSGQKVVSAILFYEPWGVQSEDKFDPMVQTIRQKDGSWKYDYSVFDRWVELCEACGISQQINCFSMVPWDMSFRYFDLAEHQYKELKTQTNTAEYKELWTSFLKSFAQHLKEKGWFDKTTIAMDERGLNNMLDAYRIVQEAVPGMKMALAGNYHAELVDKLYDYCIAYGQDFKPEELAARKAKGWVSTTYTACNNPSPNLFSNNLSADAALLPVYSVANGFDGYLHWSWMNWPQHPLEDSRFRMFSPGDTYSIYPGPRSSVRYERFIEGVAMAEKIRILREEYGAKGNQQALDALNAQVKRCEADQFPEGKTAADLVNALQLELNK